MKPKLRFTDKDGIDYPEWNTIRLGDACEVYMGQSPDSSSYNEKGDGIPLVQGNADINNRRTAPKKYTNAPTKICETGSLILTVRAPVGVVGKAVHEACIGRGVCEIRCKKVNPEYIYQFLLFNEDKWTHLEQGSTFQQLAVQI
jgi:type I restriction enzyme S subunit